MVAYMADGEPGRQGPVQEAGRLPGKPTHGHLRENRNHGGEKTGLPDPRKLPRRPGGGRRPGRHPGLQVRRGRPQPRRADRNPPVIQRGQAVTFRNLERGKRLYHSITSCKAPCNRKTGIAYPLADSKVQFESNTLGTADPRGGLDDVDHAAQPQAGHVHVLLPDPPVHAGRLPRQVDRAGYASRLDGGAKGIGRGSGEGARWRRLSGSAPRRRPRRQPDARGGGPHLGGGRWAAACAWTSCPPGSPRRSRS